MSLLWVAWSGGKDSALVLDRLRRQGIPPGGLLSTVVGTPPRVPFHGFSVRVLQAQARALGLPLSLVHFTHPPSDAEYADTLRRHLQRLRPSALAFGDIFLEDVRRFRQELFAPLGLRLLFPLWHVPSEQLAAEVLSRGIRAIITGVDTRVLPLERLGQWYDEEFLRHLPDEVDPCGERGEFHTCVVAMPGFQLRLSAGRPFRWSGPWYCCTVRFGHATAHRYLPERHP